MAENKRSRKIILPIILGAIVLGGAAYGINTYVYSRHHEYTDDAQIEGNISPVVSRVTGYVDSVLFEENQLVYKGQLLIKLDDRDLQIKVQQAQASLDNALAGVTVANANVSTSEASSSASEANVENAKIKVWKATQDYNRYENLLKDHSITEQQFDAAKAEKESAEAQLALAEKQLKTGRVQTGATSQQISVAKSMVTARQADLEYAKLQLSYARIIAPSRGYVSKKNVQPGQLVQAGQTLCTVVSENGLKVFSKIKKKNLEQKNTPQ
jgi:membrane fusion protein (multidrug efflux system)